MAKFKIKSKKVDNSHPAEKIALRKWITRFFGSPSVLEVYGGGGLMFKKVWEDYKHQTSDGDALQWLENNDLPNDIYDVDPYASPYEAMEIIAQKTSKNKIGMVCTDGTLRRVCMMRTKIPEFLQDRCKWAERDFTLMASIYHQYPSYLRHVIKSVCPGWKIEKLAIQYGKGTWKQATVYFSVILKKC